MAETAPRNHAPLSDIVKRVYKLRAVAIATGPITHLDHLGVLASYLDIPLFVTDPAAYDAALEFYPFTKVHLKSFEELSVMEQLKYNLILMSGKVACLELQNLFSTCGTTKPRVVYCPHGNSDKGHSLSISSQIELDISLAYGKHMLDLLERTGAFSTTKEIIMTGNYRYAYYKKHQLFYDAIIDKKVKSFLDPEKKTILYAPTCDSKEYNSSFFQKCAALIESNRDYNLIIKPHPFLLDREPAKAWHLIANYENHPSTLFLIDFPLIYPLLTACDIYLGEFSSVGYDFLHFDKPMFFFNTSKTMQEDGNFLHACGMTIPETEDALGFIQKNLEYNKTNYSMVRKRIYEYTFARTLSPKDLKNALRETYYKSPIRTGGSTIR